MDSKGKTDSYFHRFNIKNMPQPLVRNFILVILCVISTFPMSAWVDGESGIPVSKSRKAVRTSSDVLLVAIPVTAVGVTILEHDWEGLKQGAFSAAATVGATMILKYAIKEERPDFSNNHSFPSGHSSFTFAASTYIGRRYGWKYAIPAYALSAYTGWARVYGKKHHWWDVAAGAAIGTASSLIFTHPWMREHDAAITPVVTDEAVGFSASISF